MPQTAGTLSIRLRAEVVVQSACGAGISPPLDRQLPLRARYAHERLTALPDHADTGAVFIEHIRAEWQRAAILARCGNQQGLAAYGLELQLHHRPGARRDGGRDAEGRTGAAGAGRSDLRPSGAELEHGGRLRAARRRGDHAAGALFDPSCATGAGVWRIVRIAVAPTASTRIYPRR